MKTNCKNFAKPIFLILCFMTVAVVDALSVQLNVTLTRGVNGTGLPNQYVSIARVYPSTGSVGWGNTDASGVKTFSLQNEPNPNGFNRYTVTYYSVVNSFQAYDTLVIPDTATLEINKSYAVCAEEADCQMSFTNEYTGSWWSNDQKFTFDAEKAANCFGYYTNALYQYAVVRVRWYKNGVLFDSSTASATAGGGPLNIKNYATAIISNPGFYTICLEVIGAANGQSSYTCRTIQTVSPYKFLTGAIKADGQFVIDSVDVEMIRVDSSAYATTKAYEKNDSLVYGFMRVPPGKYIVRAIPYGSILTPNYAPTYAISALNWENADTLILTQDDYQFVKTELNLIPYYLASGIPRPGILQGYISGLGTTCQSVIPGLANTRAVLFEATKVIVLVVDNQGRPIASTFLNTDGTFYLEELPVGSYSLRIDHPLVNNQFIPVSFTEASPAMVVQATVTTSGIQAITKVKSKIRMADVEVFPNPTTGKLFLTHFDQVAEMQLKNSLGEEIDIPMGEMPDLERLSTGLYFLNGKTKEGLGFQHKIIRY